MLRTSGASSGPSTEWMQQRDQNPVPSADQEVSPLEEALRTSWERELQVNYSTRGTELPREAPADRKTFEMKGGQASLEDLWGLRLGWGPWGCRRRTRDRAAERLQSRRWGRQAAPIVTL